MIYYDIHTHHISVRTEEVAIVNTIVDAGPVCPASIDSFKRRQTSSRQDYFSVGIHPWYIYDVEEQIGRLKRLAVLPDVVAIGETGLDKGVETSLKLQLEIFKTSVSLAEDLGLFVIIHCVKAWDELIALKKELKPYMPWIIHNFRGNGTLAKQLIKQGFYLSFGERFNSGAVCEAWPDQLFAETDDREIDIRAVYQNLSTSLSLPPEQLVSQIAGNVRHILHLP